MSLTDLMSGMSLSTYPQVALVIFLIVFASVVARTYSRRRPAHFDRLAAMPLDDAPVAPEPRSRA